MSSMKVELWAPPYGDDLMVVNAARVSFGKRSEMHPSGSLYEKDVRLIQFLARGMTTEDFEHFQSNVVAAGYGGFEDFLDLLWQWRRTPTHFAPFAHPHVSFHIKAPIFVARQLAKHQVGMVWSEVSRRYVDDEPEFYTPEFWRKRADNVKQGSSDEAVDLTRRSDWYDEQEGHIPMSRVVEKFNEDALAVYEALLREGVCPEQARMVLPQSTMTEWIWTGSLYAWANVFNQRKPGGHAQRETQEIARQISDYMGDYFPVSWEALTA